MKKKTISLIKLFILCIYSSIMSLDKSDNIEEENKIIQNNNKIEEKIEQANLKKDNFSKSSVKIIKKFHKFIIELQFYLNEMQINNNEIIDIFKKNDLELAKKKDIAIISNESLINIFEKTINEKAHCNFDELKSILIYFSSLMKLIDTENLFSEKLDTIWNIKEEKELLLFCNDFFEAYKNVLDNSSLITKTDLLKLKEKYLQLIGTTIILTRNVIKNIKSGSYNKENIFFDMLSKEKTLNINNSKYIYQNSFLIPLFESLNEEFQTYLLHLEDFEEGSITEKKINVIHKRIIEPIIHFLGLTNYCINTKYSPKNNNFKNIKTNKNFIQQENDLKKEIEQFKKKITKLNAKKLKIDNNPINNYINEIIILEKKAKNFEEKNIKLTYYSLQNFYRYLFHSSQKLNRFNKFTKFFSNKLFSANAVLCFFTWEIYAYFKNINFRFGIGDGAAYLAYDLYQIIASRGESHQNNSSMKKASLDEKFQTTLMINDKSMTIKEFNEVYRREAYSSLSNDPAIKKKESGLPKLSEISDIDIYNKTITTKTGEKINLEEFQKNLGEFSPMIDALTKKIEYLSNPNIYVNEINKKATILHEKTLQAKTKFENEINQILNKYSFDKSVKDQYISEIFNLKDYVTGEQFNTINRIINFIKGGTEKEFLNEIKNNSTIQIPLLKSNNLPEQEKYKLIESMIDFCKTSNTLNHKKGSYLSDSRTNLIRNKLHTGLLQKLDSVPFGDFFVSAGLTYIGKTSASKLFKDNSITPAIINFFNNIHYYLMGKKQEIDDSERSMSNMTAPSDTGVTLDNECFSHLEKQGALEWLQNILSIVEKAVNGDPLDLSMLARIPYSCFLTGPSGCGKTYVVNAFANSLHKITKSIPKERLKAEAEFLAIDPKYFEGIIRSGEIKKIDLIEELTDLLKESLIKNTFYIIYFDEFHLFFSKDGHPNQSRIADLLKFFNDLYAKQRDHKGLGGMYVICSTNKPEFIPHEFFDNGARLGGTYHFEYGNETWMKEMMQRELNKIGAISNYIDWDYIQSVLRGYHLTHSNLLEVINKAFAYSQANNKIIDTNLIYHFINQVIRKIIVNKNNHNNEIIEDELLNSLSYYYGSLVSIVMNFEENNNDLFDMATIFPLKKNFEPQHIDRTYLRPLNKKRKYGGIFYLKNNHHSFFDKKNIAYEIIKKACGIVYLDLNNLSKFDVIESLSEIQDILHYYLATKICNTDLAKRINLAEKITENGKIYNTPSYKDLYSEQSLQEIKKILSKAEEYIINFYSIEAVKKVTNIFQNKLYQDAILRKKDIDKLVSEELQREVKTAFNILLNNIISIL